MKLHQFKPIDKEHLEVRKFSSSPDFKVCRVAGCSENLQDNDIVGYVTVEFGSSWKLGYVMDKNPTTKVAKLTLLKPDGPSQKFKFPKKSVIIEIPYCKLLTSANVKTKDGIDFLLLKVDNMKADAALKKRNKL